jgi:nucleoid-associated protein YgaU
MKTFLALLLAALTGVSAFAQSASSNAGSMGKSNSNTGTTMGGTASGGMSAVPHQMNGLGIYDKNADISNLPAGLQTLITQFRTQREQLLAARQALFASLQGKTAEEKQQILAAAKEQLQTTLDEQKALAKQIREQMRQLRDEQRKNNKGGS